MEETCIDCGEIMSKHSEFSFSNCYENYYYTKFTNNEFDMTLHYTTNCNTCDKEFGSSSECPSCELLLKELETIEKNI